MYWYSRPRVSSSERRRTSASFTRQRARGTTPCCSLLRETRSTRSTSNSRGQATGTHRRAQICVDRSGGPNGIVMALFIGSGSARDKTGLYVFGPDRRLLHTETSLSPNSGLLLLSSSEHSVAFLVGDRGRPGATRSRGKRTPRQALDKTMALGREDSRAVLRTPRGGERKGIRV